MATRRCLYAETTTGQSCRNPVDPGSDHCAAGHPCVPLPPGAQASASSSPSGVGHDFEDLVALDTHGAESDDSIGAVKTSEVEDKGRIDAEVDALAMEAYLNNTYDDVILELRLAKYAEARLTDENKQLRELLAWHTTPQFKEGHHAPRDDGSQECRICEEPWPCMSEAARIQCTAWSDTDNRCLLPANGERQGHPLCSVHARQFDRWGQEGDALRMAAYWWEWRQEQSDG